MKRLMIILGVIFLMGGVVLAQSNVDDILIKNERDAALYFWNETNPSNGLIRDRTTWDSPSSIAAVGFGLTSLCIAADHGWLPKDAVYNRILTTLEYFKSLPNEHGFYYHFLNLWTGQRASSSEVSPIDTTLFIAGALFAGQYFKGTEVQTLADELYSRIDWQWMTNNTAYINMAWYPHRGFSNSYWTGYSEATIMYILAIGAPIYPIPPQDWTYWITSWSKNGTGALSHWATSDESLFTYLYSQMYINFKNLDFKYVGNLWDNSKKAIEYDIDFSSQNAQYKTLKDGFWGLSACDGPNGYQAYGAVFGGTDGTVAPYAMIGSLPFIPNRAKEVVLKMWALRNELYGRYGFVDAFNLDQNWRDFDYIGIDVGTEVLMTENYYTGMVWKYFMQLPYVQNALKLIGAKELSEPTSIATSQTTSSAPNYNIAEDFSSPYGKYGLGTWNGGTSSSTSVIAKVVSDKRFGNAWQINYNVENAGSYNGTWLDLANSNLGQTFDASSYSKLVFYVKGSSENMNFKIELKSPNNGSEYFYVEGVGENWEKIEVPFSAFQKYSWTNPTDFSKLTQMTFVFENNVDNVKNGTIYVADIGFEN